MNTVDELFAEPAVIWTFDEGLAFVRKVEGHLKEQGFHAALSGGVLWRGSSTKDLDIILYPHHSDGLSFQVDALAILMQPLLDAPWQHCDHVRYEDEKLVFKATCQWQARGFLPPVMKPLNQPSPWRVNISLIVGRIVEGFVLVRVLSMMWLLLEDLIPMKIPSQCTEKLGNNSTSPKTESTRRESSAESKGDQPLFRESEDGSVSLGRPLPRLSRPIKLH